MSWEVEAYDALERLMTEELLSEARCPFECRADAGTVRARRIPPRSATCRTPFLRDLTGKTCNE